jgi:four helix bundle protein
VVRGEGETFEMSVVQTYRDLIAWQKGMELVIAVYRLTEKLPRDERFGLTNQLRRAAVSIPSNIAEGFGRGSDAEFQRFLSIARGSLFEVETQVEIARSLTYFSEHDRSNLMRRTDEVGRVLRGLSKSIDARSGHR